MDKLKLIVLVTAILLFSQCRKKDVVTPVEGTPVTGSGLVDASWTFDKPHSNVTWQSEYMAYSTGMLIGRFNNFNFKPKFVFDEAGLANCGINCWVQLSSIDSGEPGRDGPGKCIRSYMGVTYLDTSKTITDPVSDTAWFRSSSIVKTGTGFAAIGTFSFNRWRAPSSYPDGTPITESCVLYFTYNGTVDFDTDGDLTNDRLRASFTGKFSFLRSNHMDTNSTIQYVPVPAVTDLAGNVIAANNTTYGVWTTNVADKMELTVNLQFYKNH
jgi:polyisoprenoid-binding protein YceI